MSRGQPRKTLVGVDVFFHLTGGSAEQLAQQVRALAPGGLQLSSITNRGVKVYPNGDPGTFCVDHWACRFLSPDGQTPISHAQVAHLLQSAAGAGLDFIKAENLYTFDGERGYSLGQDE